MCLILMALDCHPKYKLIISGNRDEFYDRPTLPAHFWAEDPNILAGMDIVKQGTWTGITTAGRFAAVTVFREPKSYPSNMPSRGLLAAQYLKSRETGEEFMSHLVNRGNLYKGFSLLAGDVDTIYYLSNRENIVRKLDKGLHGLSNNLLDVPWPKVTRGLQSLSECLAHEEVNIADIWNIMANRDIPEDRELPDTGIGIELERLLGSAFITGSKYGTRATTVIMVDRHNRVRFWERSFENPQSGQHTDAYYEFMISPG
ncbi:MAG: NRDE family protein [Syntrophomonadaceae bacterium]|nr:NRDE family protein [Syntrophomonadaceae bacterium]